MGTALAQASAFQGTIPSSSTALSTSSSELLFCGAENPKLVLHISAFHHKSMISYDEALATI